MFVWSRHVADIRDVADVDHGPVDLLIGMSFECSTTSGLEFNRRCIPGTSAPTRRQDHGLRV